MYFHEEKYGYVHVYLAGPAFLFLKEVGRKVLPSWADTSTYMRFAHGFNTDRNKQLVYCTFADEAFSYFTGV